MKLLVPRRRFLKMAAPAIAMPYIRPSKAAFGIFQTGLTAFPGQTGNPVGAFAPNVPVIAPGAGINFGGTAGNPSGSLPALVSNNTYCYYDNIASGTSNYGISGVTGVTFVGTRFQGNDVSSFGNIAISGATSGISFSYCSIVPKVSLVGTSPPLNGGGSWPSSSVGSGVYVSDAGRVNYQIAFANGYQDGISVLAPSISLDHCDMWGWANAYNLRSVNNHSLTDCWIHDGRYDNNSDHTDGPGYLQGVHADFTGTISGTALTTSASPGITVPATITSGAAPGTRIISGSGTSWTIDAGHSQSVGPVAMHCETGVAPNNVTVRHCTIASIGNTNSIAFQSADPFTPYANITIVNNYISGFGNSICMGIGGGNLFVAGSNSMTFTDNILATDLKFNGPVQGAQSTPWKNVSGLGNVWARNKLKVYPGDTWSSLNSSDGFYVWPDGTFNAGDWVP